MGRSTQLSRRDFLKTSAVAAGATALAAEGTALMPDYAEADTDSSEQKFRGMCRGNCGGRCPMQVTVREGKVVRTEPMPEEAWVGDMGGERRRFCVKGFSQPQRVYDPDRLKYPLRRATWSADDPRPELRGQGEWERVSWDEAFEAIAGQISTGVGKYGGTSFAVWSSYGSYGLLNGCMAGYLSVAYGRFITLLGGTVLGAGADNAQLVEQSTLLGISGNDFVDVANAKTIVNWGGNPSEAYIHAWRWVCDARENGARMITIDPQFNAAAAHSDLYVPIIPGTDGALMLAMCNYIIDNNLVDVEYMRNNTISPFLLKADGTYLTMSDIGMSVEEGALDEVLVFDETDQKVKPLTQAQQPALEGAYAIAELDGYEAKTVYTTTQEYTSYMTVSMAAEICGIPEGTITELALAYANDGPVYTMTFQGIGHHVNSHHNYKNLAYLHALTGNAGKPGASICGAPSTGMAGFNVLAFFLGQVGVNLCGMNLPDIVNNGRVGSKELTIYTLWCCNGNVLSCEGGRQELIDAVKKIPFVVCADVNMTDTAEYADFVLPVPHSFEVMDIDVVCSVPYPSMLHKMIEPLYDCKTDLEIMRGIAAIMFPQMDIYSIDMQTPTSDEEWIRYLIDVNTANVQQGMSADKLLTEAMVPLAGYGPDSYVHVYGTAQNSRLKYYVQSPAPRVQFGQEIEDNERYPYYEHAHEAYADNPDVKSGKYPLFGCSEHGKYHVHSQLAYTPVIRMLDPEPRIKINTDDAAARGIAQGDYVHAYNDHGECVCKALVTSGIKPGVISIPHGFQRPQFVRGHAQDLTSNYMDDFCSNSAFYDFVCQVERWDGDTTLQKAFDIDGANSTATGEEE